MEKYLAETAMLNYSSSSIQDLIHVRKWHGMDQYEKIESMPLIVIKKDNNREPYDREKITAGIVRSCHKRPVSISQINNMVDEIETQIFNIGEKEISTKTIGEIVMSKLKAVDEVAYVRFASVYREFKDVDSFMEEIKKILK